MGVKPELKLNDFPEAFKEGTLIIVGDNASEIELQAANEIADYLENRTENKPLVKRYSEVTEEDMKNYNLIVIGTPNSNPMLKEVYAMADVLEVNETFPGEGKGVLEIARNPWNKERAMLLVEGRYPFDIYYITKVLNEFLVSQKYYITKTHNFVKVSGRLFVTGNEPFTKLAILANGNSFGVIIQNETIHNELWKLQGKSVVLYGYLVDGTPPFKKNIIVVKFKLMR